MSFIAKFLAITGMIAGVLGHLLLIGLCFVGMPNASEKQLAEIKGWMWLIAGLGAVVAIVGVWLYRTGHPWICLVLSLAAPVVLCVILFRATTP